MAKRKNKLPLSREYLKPTCAILVRKVSALFKTRDRHNTNNHLVQRNVAPVGHFGTKHVLFTEQKQEITAKMACLTDCDSSLRLCIGVP